MRYSFLLAFVTASFLAAAQPARPSLQLHADFLFPSSTGSFTTDAGAGAGIKKLWNAGKHGAITGSAAWHIHKISLVTASDGSSNKGSSQMIIPVLAGYQWKIKKFIAEPAAGISFCRGDLKQPGGTRSKTSGTGFTWGVQSGFYWKKMLFGAGYHLVHARSIQPGRTHFGYGGIRIGYCLTTRKR